MASGFLFFLALLSAWQTFNALRAPRPGAPPLLRPLWFPALFTAELVPLRLAGLAVVTIVLVALGALHQPLGVAALAIMLGSWLGSAELYRRGLAAADAVQQTVGDLPEPPPPPPRAGWGWPYRIPDEVERLDDVSYDGRGHTLDLYRRREASGPGPVVLYVHGGSWTGGDKRRQARPLLHHLARHGWVAVAPQYPLSPAATFPEHLVGLKRALAWIRTRGGDAGLDPSFVAVAGSSSGGHLAALLALTSNQPELQQGFEEVDTGVQAAVTFYGIFDFFNRHGVRDNWPVIPRAVMKARPQEQPERYRRASPLDLVHPSAPPFLVVHGTHDSLVPPAESRHFVTALRAVSASPVRHLEVPGATHGFETIDSRRTALVVGAVHRFLAHTRAAPPPTRPG